MNECIGCGGFNIRDLDGFYECRDCGEFWQEDESSVCFRCGYVGDENGLCLNPNCSECPRFAQEEETEPLSPEDQANLERFWNSVALSLNSDQPIPLELDEDESGPVVS